MAHASLCSLWIKGATACPHLHRMNACRIAVPTLGCFDEDRLKLPSCVRVQCELEGSENAAKRLTSRQLGRALLLEALQFAITDKEMLLPLYKKGSGTHRRKVKILEAGLRAHKRPHSLTPNAK